MSALDWAIRSIQDAPRGPQIGAFFDLDGTLVRGFTAVAFFRDFLSRGEVPTRSLISIIRASLAHRRAPDNGQGIIEEGIAFLAGRELTELEARAEKVFRKRIAATIRAGARALVQAHRDAGHTLVVASAATPFQVGAVARDLGIPNLLTTAVAVKDGRLTGALDGLPLWGAEKARAVETFAQEHGIDLAASFGYGNGREDRLFLEAVGRPVAVSPDAGLTEIARSAHIPVLSLEDPPRPGLRGAVGTLRAVSTFNTGLAATLAATAVVGKHTAFRYGFGATADRTLSAAGVALRVVGRENIDAARPAVYIFNHQSNLDPLIVVSLVRRDVTAVGKKEAVENARGFLLRFFDIALIDRSNSTEARATVSALVNRIRAGESVLIAPEGTRMPTPKPGRFKRGAFHLALDAQVPLIPIVFRNTGALWPRGTMFISPGVVDVCVLPPIPTDGWSREEIGDRADAIREKFAAVLEHWPQTGDAIPTREP